MKTMSIIGIVIFIITLLIYSAHIHAMYDLMSVTPIDIINLVGLVYGLSFSIVILVISTKMRMNYTNTNIADELIKLSELKDKGVLTEEEFNTKKTKLFKL